MLESLPLTFDACIHLNYAIQFSLVLSARRYYLAIHLNSVALNTYVAIITFTVEAQSMVV